MLLAVTFRGALNALSTETRKVPTETQPLSPHIHTSVAGTESQRQASYMNPEGIIQLQTTSLDATLMNMHTNQSANLVGVTGKGSTIFHTKREIVWIVALFLTFMASSLGIIIYLFDRNRGGSSVS